MNDPICGFTIIIICVIAILIVIYKGYVNPSKSKQEKNNNSQITDQKYQPSQQISVQTQIEKPIIIMEGVQDRLVIYDDRVTITPQGVLGLINKGAKGTKEIPFHSIIAVQIKQLGMLSGYLQFTISGGNESRGGILDATKDENTFMFRGSENNELAIKVKNYITSVVKEMRAPKVISTQANLADEIEKLAKLREQGILSEQEFQAAKAKLINGWYQ